MIACVDVCYRVSAASAACVLAERWTDERPWHERLARIAAPQPYEPGRFYLRELPGVLAVLQGVHEPVEVVVVDGYVWLDSRGRRGLGARVHDALGGGVAVVGVAKSPFAGGDFAVRVLRGASRRPLFVTAVGMDAAIAAERVRAMHGAHRIPTLLARADRLARAG
jgi:deoxyribonuclease V